MRGCVAHARVARSSTAVEQADLPDGVTLEDVRIDPAAPIMAGRLPDIPVSLTASGTVERARVGRAVPGPAPPRSQAEPLDLTAIPYFLWGNRKPGPMRVWIPVAA